MAKIILENKAKIDIETKYFKDLLSYAKLPDGLILLVLYDSSLPENKQGVCIVPQLKRFAPSYSDICICSYSSSWNCCIVIPKKWCVARNEFPAYFTYLIGHELGHAYICLSDITLHIHCCLIHLSIKSASKDKIQFPHELPNEQLFDQFGKYIALKLHGDKKLIDEINSLKGTAGNIKRQRLELIQRLPPEKNFSDLRKTMIDFSRPYKDELIRYWKIDVNENGYSSLASLIYDYDKLFQY